MLFLQFLTALWKWWWALMSCAIFTLIGWFGAAHDKSNVWYVKASFAAAAMVFVFASFMAWLDEHKQYEIEKAKHENPNFELEVESILTSYNQIQNITTLCFAAMLVNRGSASHAGGWSIRYQSPTVDMTVRFLSLPQEKVLFPVVGGHDLVLKRMDMLPARTLAAIERGHTRHGRLLFELHGDRRAEIHTGAAQMWIGCSDNTGRLSQTLFKTGPAHSMLTLRTYPDEETTTQAGDASMLQK